MKLVLITGALLTGLCLSPVALAADKNSSSSFTLPQAIWATNERVREILEPTSDFSKPEKYELLQGGAGTSQKSFDRNAYSQQTQTLDFEGLQAFKIGNALFNKLWVSSPSSTLASDGIGPFFNARACQSCHIKDGRGQLPSAGEKTSSLVLQLKNQNGNNWGKDPIYGHQIHTSAVPGVKAEAIVTINKDSNKVVLSDGTVIKLSQPEYSLSELAYGQLDEHTVASPRLAPSMIGLGLLQAIDAEFILAYADPEDLNEDGISGRANWQDSDENTKNLGRFGHKAASASIKNQTANAFSTDMGLSSSIFSDPNGDCTEQQTLCSTLANGVQKHLSNYEVSDEILDWVTFYSENLAVPARRNINNKVVLKGKSLFYGANCIACHVPKHVTSNEASQPEHKYQLIWPYTDLLLHDMGEGLADNAGEGEANGREWRTAPLWGIGLAKTVNPRTSYLHDGRASSLLEAILWHGGEAQAAKEQVTMMSASERYALITFLESL